MSMVIGLACAVTGGYSVFLVVREITRFGFSHLTRDDWLIGGSGILLLLGGGMVLVG